MPDYVRYSAHLRDEVSDVAELLELLTPPTWHRLAACRQHPELPWLPTRGDKGTAIAAAQAVCRTCPVADRCAEAAEDLDARLDRRLVGIWAGATGAQRRKARARTPAA